MRRNGRIGNGRPFSERSPRCFTAGAEAERAEPRGRPARRSTPCPLLRRNGCRDARAPRPPLGAGAGGKMPRNPEFPPAGSQVGRWPRKIRVRCTRLLLTFTSQRSVAAASPGGGESRCSGTCDERCVAATSSSTPERRPRSKASCMRLSRRSSCEGRRRRADCEQRSDLIDSRRCASSLPNRRAS